MGDIWPRAECRRRRLYHASMKSKTAIRASAGYPTSFWVQPPCAPGGRQLADRVRNEERHPPVVLREGDSRQGHARRPEAGEAPARVPRCLGGWHPVALPPRPGIRLHAGGRAGAAPFRSVGRKARKDAGRGSISMSSRVTQGSCMCTGWRRVGRGWASETPRSGHRDPLTGDAHIQLGARAVFGKGRAGQVGHDPGLCLRHLSKSPGHLLAAPPETSLPETGPLPECAGGLSNVALGAIDMA